MLSSCTKVKCVQQWSGVDKVGVKSYRNVLPVCHIRRENRKKRDEKPTDHLVKPQLV